jgi:hypothetical protein
MLDDIHRGLTAQGDLLSLLRVDGDVRQSLLPAAVATDLALERLEHASRVWDQFLLPTTPRPDVRTRHARARPPAVLALARSLAAQAAELPTIEGKGPIRATASRTGWFVEMLRWLIDQANFHALGCSSAEALADKALQRTTPEIP